jgi:phosphoglycerate dehydrogenase-like enzyme
VLTPPLNEETQQLMDRDHLALLPDGALVVNVSRGPVVNTAALVAELAQNRLRAALDVVDPEPLPPGHPLWEAPGVILTPHVGGATSAFEPRIRRFLHDQLQRIAAGEEPRNLVVRGDLPPPWDAR